MSKLRFTISISLDGYAAGPDQSIDDPLGVGGGRLHEWLIPLRVFRERCGLDGGDVNDSSVIAEEMFDNVGATVMGRNMFGGQPGAWDARRTWNGWWGDNPPYHHPVFVVTHHARAPLELEGGTTFHFVTDGIESALDQARQAANGKDVALGGGAATARQFLDAALVDQMTISIVPVLLGGGERLFKCLGDDSHGLKPVRTIAAQDVVHLTFARSA